MAEPTHVALWIDQRACRHWLSEYGQAQPERERLRVEIRGMLLSHRLELLEAIVASKFTTEQLTQVTQSIIKLLFTQSSAMVERFLRNILARKIVAYHAENPRDGAMKNVLRDNSLEVLLLSLYVRSEARAYLVHALAAPILARLDDLAAIETDPNRASPEVVAASEAKLQLICVELITAIMQSHRLFPTSVRQLCVFLREHVDVTLGISQPTPRAAMLPPLQFDHMVEELLAVAGCATPSPYASEDESVSPTGAVVGLAEEAAAAVPDEDGSFRERLRANSRMPAAARTGSYGRQHKSADPMSPAPAEGGDASTAAGSVPSLGRPLEWAGFGDAAPSLPTASSTSAPALGDAPLLSTDPPPAARRASASASTTTSPSEENAVMRRRALKRTNALNRRSHLVTYTVSDQIVSTFLFLRVYVPAITLPDQYGIIDGDRLDRSVARGLLQCGKLLMTICNDAESKNSTVTGAQLQFLLEQRKRLKLFVGMMTAPDPASLASTEATVGPQQLSSTTTTTMSMEPQGMLSTIAANARLAAAVAKFEAPPPSMTVQTNLLDPLGALGGSLSSASPVDASGKKNGGNSIKSMFTSLRHKKNHHRSLPQLTSIGAGAPGNESTSGLSDSPSGSSSTSIGSSAESHPTDALVAQIAKGMERIENYVVSRLDGPQQRSREMTLTVLRLKTAVDQFLAVPTSSSDALDAAGGRNGEPDGRGGSSNGGAKSASFLKNIGRRLWSRSQRSLNETGSADGSSANSSSSFGSMPRGGGGSGGASLSATSSGVFRGGAGDSAPPSRPELAKTLSDPSVLAGPVAQATALQARPSGPAQ
ncbi:hypothetical protein H9P43_000532 [Blastocladiella emersonii ATCC 22665]|nr:hypothetical protein H9P43_000532 [Blastocladiella emersonii ATCC 22665]